MIVDRTVKALMRRSEAGGPDVDGDVRALVRHLNAVCARPDNKARYAGDPAFASVIEDYPLDLQGYAKGFDPLEDEAGFVAAWRRYGVVVGKGILTQGQCVQAVGNLKARFNAISGGRCDLDRPETWADMPVDAAGTPILSRGFLEIYHDDMIAQIRQNVRAYLHHVLIWGRADLWASFDRAGVKLPGHEDSKALPLHVDQNPNIHPHFKTVQGVLALADCPAERGTFMGVPGSRGAFAAYAAMARNNGEYVELDHTAPMAAVFAAHAKPLPLRAGDMVTWDSRTTHANTANISDKTRFVLYLAAGPQREDNPQLVAARMGALRSGEGSNVREALMHASKKPRYTDLETLARVRVPERLNLLGKLLYGMESYGSVVATPAP